MRPTTGASGTSSPASGTSPTPARTGGWPNCSQRDLTLIGKHRGPGVSDLLLAATALTHGLVVLHHDRDFLAIAEVSDSLRQQPVVPFGSL